MSANFGSPLAARAKAKLQSCNLVERDLPRDPSQNENKGAERRRARDNGEGLLLAYAVTECAACRLGSGRNVNADGDIGAVFGAVGDVGVRTNLHGPFNRGVLVNREGDAARGGALLRNLFQR